jgi:hypothetical protein
MMLGDSELTELERQLVRVAGTGELADLRTGDAHLDHPSRADEWGTERTARASLLAELLTGLRQSGAGPVRAVRLRGAWIVGALDLEAAVLVCPLLLHDCAFEQPVNLREARAKAIRLPGSHVPGIAADQLHTEGNLELNSGFTASAEICLRGAQIGGRLDLSSASITSLGGLALDADGLTVEQSMSCGDGFTATGGVRLSGAHIGGRLGLDGAELNGSGGPALDADGLTVRLSMFCRDGFTARGEVRLRTSQIGGQLNLVGATLTNPGGRALSALGLTVGQDMFCGHAFAAEGEVRLTGARIGGSLDFSGARLVNPSGHALYADGSIVEGTLRLTELRACGEVTIRTGRIGQRVMLTGAQLENPDRIALALSGTEIVSDLFCRDASINGEARLAGTRIRGHLDLDCARLVNPTGIALNAISMQTGELSLRPAEPIQGVVDLSHAHVGIFRDDPASWPSELNLDGLTYSALEPQLPVQQRLRWLARHQYGHQLQPYEQLAANYNGLGQPVEARRVLYARERLQRRNRTPLARTWSFLQDITVAYGYQPWRAVLWLALLLAAGSTVFALNPPPPLQSSAAPHFNPVIYTLDLLLPVVDLGQKHAFNPAGAEQWFAYLLTAAGWVLATTIAAGAARVLSRR